MARDIQLIPENYPLEVLKFGFNGPNMEIEGLGVAQLYGDYNVHEFRESDLAIAVIGNDIKFDTANGFERQGLHRLSVRFRGLGVRGMQRLLITARHEDLPFYLGTQIQLEDVGVGEERNDRFTAYTERWAYGELPHKFHWFSQPTSEALKRFLFSFLRT